jgi:nucleoside-diphosphate-sugar epimerase
MKDAQTVHRDFRAGDVLHSQADIGKAQRLLGYEPTHSIGQGLAEALGWHEGQLTRSLPTKIWLVTGFLNMLVAARDARVRRFVYAASSSTYGDHPAQ